MASLPPLPEDPAAYDSYVESMRRTEYPMLQSSTYLDHAGTALYSKTQMLRFHSDMMADLYGNPHAASPSSQRSTREVDDARLRVLSLVGADADAFDVVFVANATAGIKMVGEAMRELEGGFEFVYHLDSHTSLVGVREVAARGARCLGGEGDVDEWLCRGEDRGVDDEGAVDGSGRTTLFAYPAQSNMNGRRLPLRWCKQATETNTSSSKTYTLLDAAAYASTSPLDLSDVESAPDFTVLSLYKIFGFPDLGALIVKKSASHLFNRRRFFGGGTVDMVVCRSEQWHARKSGPLHERLEDGTLPVHNILALKSAIRTHEELFGTLERVSRHTSVLARELYEGLCSLKHGNDQPVCEMYKHKGSTYGDPATQGPIVAFNLRDAHGNWVSNAEVEKLASIKDIHLRTGGVCNPGGVATALDLAPWEMRENFSAGYRCGGENDILNGKPTGVVRLSLGAMSTRSDVRRLLKFVDEFFVDKTPPQQLAQSVPHFLHTAQHRFYVESLTVYPIKSCGGWQVPSTQPWQIRTEGLAWDREWCVIHQGTGKALSQKQHPQMTLLRPHLDFKAGVLRVSVAGTRTEISVPLSRNPTLYVDPLLPADASVCGDPVKMLVYKSPAVASFFTTALNVPCTLARFNPASPSAGRHSKPHLLPTTHSKQKNGPRPITLTNESPILTISRSSLNRLNEQIKAKGGKAAHPAVFRANIVLAEHPLFPPGREEPWAEDGWCGMRIGGGRTQQQSGGGVVLECLGGCGRCGMVCVDQESGVRDAEPFVTLAKTRRVGGRVVFGVHCALASQDEGEAVGVGGRGGGLVRVGDGVETF